MVHSHPQMRSRSRLGLIYTVHTGLCNPRPLSPSPSSLRMRPCLNLRSPARSMNVFTIPRLRKASRSPITQTPPPVSERLLPNVVTSGLNPRFRVRVRYLRSASGDRRTYNVAGGYLQRLSSSSREELYGIVS